MISKIFTYSFLAVAVTYLFLTMHYKSAHPIDQYYFLINKPINYDTLVFIKHYNIREMYDENNWRYYESDKQRLPNTYLDTNWGYFFEGICRNNLSQPLYLSGVQVFYGPKNSEYPWKMSVRINARKNKTHVNNIIESHAPFDITITPQPRYRGDNNILKDSINNNIMESGKYHIILTTTMGKFDIYPTEYRIENLLDLLKRWYPK